MIEKEKSVNSLLEEFAKVHLGVCSLHKSQFMEKYSIEVEKIRKALKVAYLTGEKNGYKHGFSDAKEACNCSLEYVDSQIDTNIEEILSKF